MSNTCNNVYAILLHNILYIWSIFVEIRRYSIFISSFQQLDVSDVLLLNVCLRSKIYH